MKATVLLILTLVLGAPMAAAAEAEATSSGLTLQTNVGLNGYVDPQSPFPVVVELSSDALFVGRLELSTRTGVVPVTVEVPAGGVKQYELIAGAPADRHRITVTVLDEDGEEVARETVTLRVAVGELLVGTIGTDGVTGLDTALRSTRSAPLDRPVSTVTVRPEDIGPALAPVKYLIAGDGAFSNLDAEAQLLLTQWLDRGGRLYGTESAISAVTELGHDTVSMGNGVAVARQGAGEIGVVEDLAMSGPDAWVPVLRDRPGAMAIIDQATAQSHGSLMAAASSGQNVSVPALPWLLAGIVVFVLLVGPVNFLVLRTLGRPEMAWLTVPALSLVFLGGFWAVGRSQLSDSSVSHATVVIDDGGGSVAQTGLLFQVAGAGEHRISVPSEWQALPTTAPSGVRSGVSEDDVVVFELESLGLGATEMRWTEQEQSLDASVSAESDGLVVTVENTSQWPMWAWGVVINGAGHNGSGALAPGESGTIEVPRGAGRTAFEPVISETVARRPYSQQGLRDTYGSVLPMAAYVETAVPQIRRSGVYVFGLTSGRSLRLTVDGRDGDSPGTTLMVRRVAAAPGDLAQLGGVRPEILDVKGASSVERYGDEVYAYGAESVTLLYEVPDGAPAHGALRQRFAGFDRVEWWSWTEGEFFPLPEAASLDLAAMTSPGGELVVRASVDEADSFFDQSISLQRYAITWEDA